MTSPIPEQFYICEPSKNHTCKNAECYAYGGTCFLTKNKEAKSPYISEEFVREVSPTLGSNLLPKTLQQVRTKKMYEEEFTT